MAPLRRDVEVRIQFPGQSQPQVLTFTNVQEYNLAGSWVCVITEDGTQVTYPAHLVWEVRQTESPAMSVVGGGGEE